MDHQIKTWEGHAKCAEVSFDIEGTEQKAPIANTLNACIKQNDTKKQEIAFDVAAQDDREIIQVLAHTIDGKDESMVSKSVHLCVQELEGKIKKDKIQTNIVKLQRDKLIKEVAELKASNKVLEAWNERLKVQFESLLGVGEDLAASNASLEQEKKKDKSQCEEYSTTIIIMDNRIRELMLHIENLDVEIENFNREHEALLLSESDCNVGNFEMKKDAIANELIETHEDSYKLEAYRVLVQCEKNQSEKTTSDLDQSTLFESGSNRSSVSNKSISTEQENSKVHRVTGFFNL
jgi:cell division protein FtsB